jgi:peptidoglycan hydrolase-like protein with peptidoglycan-binding domain
VSQLQRCLNRVQRSGLAVDGDFGPVTSAAVRAFQRSSGRLLVDGEYGPRTAGRLAAARRRVR